MEELNAIVQQVVQVSPIMKVFRIAPLGWELPDFKPGQFVAIALPPSAPRIERLPSAALRASFQFAKWLSCQ